ncbi:hypothetical protein JHU04_004381 [Brenneria sp. 4F2]|nr:hypothetical protein [Brenneria bubanii]
MVFPRQPAADTTTVSAPGTAPPMKLPAVSPPSVLNKAMAGAARMAVAPTPTASMVQLIQAGISGLISPVCVFSPLIKTFGEPEGIDDYFGLYNKSLIYTYIFFIRFMVKRVCVFSCN